MASTDRKKHHLLYIGYALIVAVLVLGVLAFNATVDRGRLHKKTLTLDHRIEQLDGARQQSEIQLKQQAEENTTQDQLLGDQHRRIRRQETAISRLAQLRERDAKSITALHNELAVHRVAAAPIARQLHQLEANNAAARNVISTAPAEADKVKP